MGLACWLGGGSAAAQGAATAVDDVAAVFEDDPPTEIDVLANDTGPGPLKVVSATQPARGGTVAVAEDGSGITFEPTPDWCNDGRLTPNDLFTYELEGGSRATVRVTIYCMPDPTVAVDDHATVTEDDGPTQIDVLANDRDPDGYPKRVTAVFQPANGAVAITGDGTGLTYEPDPDYCNEPSPKPTDDFVYELTGRVKATATVAVTVICTEDPSIAEDDPVNFEVSPDRAIFEDAPATVIDVLANDHDADGDPLEITGVTDPRHGTVTVAPDGGTLSYAPDPDYCNFQVGPTDDFTYELNGQSEAAVRVTVYCQPDPTVTVDDVATVAAGSGPTVIDVLANDSDPDGEFPSPAITSLTKPPHGRVQIADSRQAVTYEPDPGYCNDRGSEPTDDFTYTVDHDSTATVSVTVTCPTVLPTARPDSATVSRDSPATPIDVLANDTNPDGLTMRIGSATQPDHGTVAVAADGSALTYRPDPGYCNDVGPVDQFSYALDPGGSTALVGVRVICSDEPPPEEQPSGPEGALEIDARRLEISRTGRVRVRVRCVGRSGCRGTIQLQTRKRLALSANAKRKRHTLAKTGFDLGTGVSDGLVLKLKGRKLKLVRSSPKARKALLIAGKQVRKRVKLVPKQRRRRG